jgi:hypothetical protein
LRRMLDIASRIFAAWRSVARRTVSSCVKRTSQQDKGREDDR